MTTLDGATTTTTARAEAVTEERPSLYQQIREDRRVNDWSLWRPGLQAMIMYRLGRWAMEKPRTRRPVLWLCAVMHVFIRNVYGIELYLDARIGRRFSIAHQGGIVIHQFATIGDDCCIRQNSTIGAADDFDPARAPVLGDKVELGAGSVVMGAVRIGNNVRIGPNAVVSTDVPDNTTVFSPRPRMVSWGDGET